MARKRKPLKTYPIDMTEAEYESVMAFLSSLRGAAKSRSIRTEPLQSDGKDKTGMGSLEPLGD